MQGPIGRYITLNTTVSVHQLLSSDLISKIKTDWVGEGYILKTNDFKLSLE